MLLPERGTTINSTSKNIMWVELEEDHLAEQPDSCKSHRNEDRQQEGVTVLHPGSTENSDQTLHGSKYIDQGIFG